MTERVSQGAVEAGVAEALRLTEAERLDSERQGNESPEEFAIRRILEAALPALREQLEAEVREGLAAEFERRATDAAGRQIPDLIVRTLEDAANLARTFGTTEEGN